MKSLDEQAEMAEKIMAKYQHNTAELHEKATSKELRTVMMYIANEANHKQRVVAGLDRP
ncbi:hypothetical protein ACFQ44_03055 [Levilactobacillus lanxiensis]|uniref:Uncharacterized protein n=1 Tax=Levilactobacillus lanxiensis TaxID=2799568 RepID=A0ABW4CZC8_9LACO|nr:hypothetical protein [Levilactobacillus lanxiensis]